MRYGHRTWLLPICHRTATVRVTSIEQARSSDRVAVLVKPVARLAAGVVVGGRRMANSWKAIGEALGATSAPFLKPDGFDMERVCPVGGLLPLVMSFSCRPEHPLRRR